MYHKLTCFNDVALIPALKTLKILTTRAIVWRGTVNFACLIFFITHHGQLAPWSFWNPKLHAISRFKTLTGLELAMMGDKKNQACVYRQTMRSTFPLLILIVFQPTRSAQLTSVYKSTFTSRYDDYSSSYRDVKVLNSPCTGGFRTCAFWILHWNVMKSTPYTLISRFSRCLASFYRKENNIFLPFFFLFLFFVLSSFFLFLQHFWTCQRSKFFQNLF